jgi:GT2 family glycosyltransferase
MQGTISQVATSPATTRQSSPSVSVVIVVWNAKKFVLECLNSLREYCASVCAEVVIVDNASTDGTPEFVAKMFPEFTLIRNSENLGFAKANNIGMSQSSGEYICLVNSDVKFTSDPISPMVEYLKEHHDVGMVTPKMLGADGVTVFRSTMRFPTLWNSFCRALGLDIAFRKSRLFGGLLMSDFDHQTTAPVEVANGWFVIVRRRAIETVGGLDPRFFMYGEDLDWCYRFWKAGERIVFFADAEAIHYGGASSSKAPLRFYLEQCFANWQYWRKHYRWPARLTFLATLGIYHSVRLLDAVLRYFFSPSTRAESLNNLKRNAICLHWISRPQRRPLEMGIDLGRQPLTEPEFD